MELIPQCIPAWRPPAKKFPVLEPETAHIWRVPLDEALTGKVISCCRKILAPDEIERAQSFQSAPDRCCARRVLATDRVDCARALRFLTAQALGDEILDLIRRLWAYASTAHRQRISFLDEGRGTDAR